MAGPREAGKKAFRDGLSSSDCPYDGEEADDWQEGWTEAEDEADLEDDPDAA